MADLSPDAMAEDWRKLGDATRALTDALADAAGRVKDLRSAASGGSAPEGGGPGGGGGGGGSAIGQALGGIVGTLGVAKAALLAIPAAVTVFVDALNPYLIEQFGTALKNISATIGVAFEGMMGTVLTFTRQINDVIAPVFSALAPVISRLAAETVVRLLPVVRLLAETFKALVPALELFAEFMRPVQELLPFFASMLRLAVAVIAGLFEGMGGVFNHMRVITDVFVEALKSAARATIVFAANMAKFLGLDKVVESIRRTFGPQKPEGRVAVTGPAAISDFASIIREATIAAATAQGGGVKSEAEWLGDISAQIDAALAKQEDFEKKLRESLVNVLRALGLDRLGIDVGDIAAIARGARGAAGAPSGIVSIGGGGVIAMLTEAVRLLKRGG